MTTHKYVSLTHLRYHPFLEGPRSIPVSRCFEIGGNQPEATFNWSTKSQPKIDSKKRSVIQGSIHLTSQILHVNSCVEIQPATLKNHEQNPCLGFAISDHIIQRKKETHCWIQTLWNLSLLGFSICLQA